MATTTITEPKQLEAHLSKLVLALHANVDDHPLLELGDTACTYMIALIKKDPAHKADEKGNRGFYSIVRDIVRRFENLQAEGNPKPTHARLCHLDKYRLRRLKGKLDSAYKAASTTQKPLVCRWEDVLILTGGVVSTISAAPGLDVLKPVGSVLSQLGELVKTAHSNKAEYADLLRLATAILAELTTKFQAGHVKPTEDMQRNVRDFERTLIRIRDSITELEREPRVKRLGRLLFANKTKEELGGLQKELERAQMVFMTSNMFAMRLEVQAVHLEVKAVRALEVDTRASGVVFFF
ncbi:hypothetical protein AAF712_004870 [Marasmius tenuissimus]|uniref:Fungal N-terminal domain-containing protein n=1 Tax=Marasmius tenuissimus TaxID=585030 RepID=A0ABR3A1X7_9AGAR